LKKKKEKRKKKTFNNSWNLLEDFTSLIELETMAIPFIQK